VYLTLDPAKILGTLERLRLRIEERFPDAGLLRVCGEVIDTARRTEERCAWIDRPQLALRIAVAVVVLLLFASLAGLVWSFTGEAGTITFFEFVQVFEAGLNDVVLVGAAIFFLLTFENRLKRQRALEGLHELRSLAHVVDMHQLTKDPVRMRHHGRDTASSPRRTLTPFELTRYLDYSAELLSLVGKTAALYAQHLNDAVVLSAVHDIETLTNELSVKVWQKVMSVEVVPAGDPDSGG